MPFARVRACRHQLHSRWAHPLHPSSGTISGIEAVSLRHSRMTWSKVRSVQDLQSLELQGAQPKRLFSFGVITDVQYADIPDGFSYHGVPRYYRNSLVALHRAVDSWRSSGVDFAVHFGDILDGYQPREGSVQALQDIIAALDRLQRPHYHMHGNHCFYNLCRQQLNQMLRIPAQSMHGASHYSVSPHPALRLVVLDGYDISLLGWPEGHPHHEQARQILEQRNPNAEKNSPEGLQGVDRRFVKFGGGVSALQLQWLQEQLEEAQQMGQALLVACHLPLCPGTCPPACLLWNYEDVLQLLRASGTVAATICGHAHQNGYVVDAAGIHHLVLPAVLETPPGRDAYGVVEVYEECLVLRGTDTMMSLKMELKGRRRVRAGVHGAAAASAADAAMAGS